MDNTEAIKHLDSLIGNQENKDNLALKAAVAALNRLIPKQIQEKTGSKYYCPNCNAWFHMVRWEQPSGSITKPKELVGITPYCGCCGQALDWSKVGNK